MTNKRLKPFLINIFYIIFSFFPNLNLNFTNFSEIRKRPLFNIVKTGYLKSKFKKIGEGVRIDEMVRVINPNTINIGNNSAIEYRSQLIGGTHLSVGNDVIIKSGTILKAGGFDYSHIIIGNDVHINMNSYIDGNGGVEIGNNVLIAPNCTIVSSAHEYISKEIEIINQESFVSKIKIDDGVWLGANVTIIPGITIGKGAVVGAGAVVTEDLPPYSVSVGVPAKIIKYRK